MELETEISRLLGATSCQLLETIQSLWSGYGVIRRVRVDQKTAILKHIVISQAKSNRRGWGSDFSHRRKVRSYAVEANFYQCFAARCHDECRVPGHLGSVVDEDCMSWLIVLEDLDQAGFESRCRTLSDEQLFACLEWLANFHGTFLQTSPKGLWPTGTYWHLATRPDEWEAMADGPLKELSPRIDAKLENARFKTLVHGDAKVANFCFSSSQSDQVAAVDFQYVGGGCGMKDVAYFISSSLDDEHAQRREAELLDVYFAELRRVLQKNGNESVVEELESEWRALYPFAWADFYRFLAGWSPGHWKMNRYSEKLTQQVIAVFD